MLLPSLGNKLSVLRSLYLRIATCINGKEVEYEEVEASFNLIPVMPANQQAFILATEHDFSSTIPEVFLGGRALLYKDAGHPGSTPPPALTATRNRHMKQCKA